MSDVAVQVPEAPERVNSIGRIFGALFSPKGTFQSIVRRPTWLAPIILLTIISFGMNFMLAGKVDWRAYIQNTLQRSGRLDRIPADRVDQVLNQSALGQKYSTYVRGAVGDTFAALIGAAIYLGAFNILVGADLKYKTALSVVSYAMVPSGLKEILGIVILALKEPSTINPINFVSSNVGAFLGTDIPTWLTVLGAALDIFTIWGLILTVIGFHAANPKKITRGTSIGVVVGVFLFFLILGVGVTAAFS